MWEKSSPLGFQWFDHPQEILDHTPVVIFQVHSVVIDSIRRSACAFLVATEAQGRESAQRNCSKNLTSPLKNN
jgi:hypothetical protein